MPSLKPSATSGRIFPKEAMASADEDSDRVVEFTGSRVMIRATWWERPTGDPTPTSDIVLQFGPCEIKTLLLEVAGN